MYRYVTGHVTSAMLESEEAEDGDPSAQPGAVQPAAGGAAAPAPGAVPTAYVLAAPVAYAPAAWQPAGPPIVFPAPVAHATVDGAMQ